MAKEMTNEEYLKKLGDRIAKMRNQIGLTQSQFAEQNGLNRSYYARIESGRINTSICNLRDIAKGLGIDVGELVAI